MKQLTKGQKISKSAHEKKERKSMAFNIGLEGNRIYLSSFKDNSVSVKVDITPVFHFLKEFFKDQYKITNFRCSEHGKIKSVPACPKCLNGEISEE